MIKVNLAPIDELESQYWYLPEVVMLVVVVALSWYGMQIYLDGIRSEIATITAETASKQTAYTEITKDTARYDQLDKDIARLNEKLDALKKITVSKIARFKPVVLLEHLQNLKPEGVWFNYIVDNTEKNALTVVGKSFDSILVAEFMTAMAATKIQEMDESDLRTQIYFDDIRLERVSSNGNATSGGGRRSGRISESQPMEENVTENVGDQWNSSDKFFPELAQYPGYHLTLVYRERVPNPKPVEIIKN